MSAWRSPKTAPRDGTIIAGLFERKGKRAISFLATFDVDAYRLLLTDPAPDSDPQWVRDSEDDALERYRTDPGFGFRPISDSDEAISVGRLIGWRPEKDRQP